jgi:AraC-like DNA-binding protein
MRPEVFRCCRVRVARIAFQACSFNQHRYFGGLSLEETAAAVGVSLATVKREFRFAHAWLATDLAGSPPTRGHGA